jgi:uncharacterized DUF497 family protein
MIFEWDEAKRIGNLAKHGVDFEAVRDFDWTTSTQSADRRWDYGEVRWQARGLIGARLHVLVFTWRGDRVRVISLRRANILEVKDYETKDLPSHPGRRR